MERTAKYTMKYYNRIAIALAIVLSLSTLTGCYKIAVDENVNTDDNTTEITSLNEDTSEQLAEVSTAPVESVTFVDSSVSAEIIISDSEVSTDSSTSQEVTNIASNTVMGFDNVPVDGSVSNSSVVVQSISLSKDSVTVEVGESDMPIVTMSPSNSDDKSEIWESSNPQIATVDSKGNITGISEGTCTVTVTAKANTSVYAKISVTVIPKTETQAQTQQNTSSNNEVTEPTYIEGVLIANKTYALPRDYDPYNGNIAPEVQEAFNRMEQDARAEGLNLYISSGFRSYDYQAGLYERYASRDGYDMADTYSARAGHSEHQTGLCFDLNTIDDSFANTPEGIWVAENCYKYGFIIRYPKGKESITGYQYEPWHLRYLGEFLATDVYNSGLCLEEYLGITSEYAD